MNEINTAVQKPVIALVSEYPPPYAGMTVLADKMLIELRADLYNVIPVRTNFQFSGVFLLFDKIRGFRGLIRWLKFIYDCRNLKKVDIVHIFSSSGLNYILFTVPVIYLSRVYKFKTIIHYHGGGAYEYFIKNKRLLSWSMDNIDRLVVPSGYLSEKFARLGYDSLIIPNHVDIDNFSFKPGDIKPVLLSVRNLTPVYNISCTINAFKIVVDNYPDAILNIAGDGPEMSNLKLQAKQLGIEKNINFLGNLPNDKIPELFSKCSILINTPIIDNMPGSILEAYACGLAVVSTNVGGIPFIVNHGVTGMLSDSGDSNCLAKNIIYFIENKESAYEMISNARHFVENLSWGLVGKQWGELYNSLCQQIEKN